MLERLRTGRAGRRAEERGAVAVVTAVAAALLLVSAAFCVDIGNAWAVRGQLQVQADDAATYAAEGLPLQAATNASGSSRLDIAKRVAYQVVCHPVRGQREHDATLPATCPSGPTSATLNTYAQKLLTTGLVTFPDSLSVKVSSPVSDVTFGFGGAAGADGVSEQKSGTARIFSPGSQAPVALSLQCLLSAGGAAPLAGDLLTNVVPLNYITPGRLGADSTAEQPAGVTTAAMLDGPGTLQSISPTSFTQGGGLLNPTTITPTFTGPSGLLSLATPYRVHFWRAASSSSVQHFTADGTYTKALVLPPLASSVTIPNQVQSTPGVWYVQVQWGTLTTPVGSGPYTGRTSAKTLTVLPPAGVESLVGCAGLVDSPRRDTGSDVVTGETMRRNLKSGMDHPLTAHPSLATLSPPASLSPSSIVGALSGGLLNCAGATGTVLDNKATLLNPAKPLPNCMTIAADGARQIEFTEGMLGNSSGTFKGRLSCSVDPTGCSVRTGFALPGMPGTFNDDRLEDFKRSGSSILSANVFFGLSGYLTGGLPVLSPPSTALRSELYKSPRFMWVAVVSRANLASTTVASCSTCPVLTFRPVFLTQSQPSGLAALDALTTQLSNLTGGLLGSLLPVLFPFLAPSATSTDHGLVMSGTTLRAVRFQTIEPSSLPVPPASYDGPVSTYLGTGPKIVRLVQ